MDDSNFVCTLGESCKNGDDEVWNRLFDEDCGRLGVSFNFQVSSGLALVEAAELNLAPESLVNAADDLDGFQNALNLKLDPSGGINVLLCVGFGGVVLSSGIGEADALFVEEVVEAVVASCSVVGANVEVDVSVLLGA